MIPAILITFRETIEAALIVATIIGILTKLNLTRLLGSVWRGTFSAICFLLIVLGMSSFGGNAIREFFDSKYEPLFEGTMLVVSSFFITWAVFFLHKTFAHKKLALLSTVREKIETRSSQTIFFLVFTAVVREGLEVVLFLSTLFFSNTPVQVSQGVGIGILTALILSFLLVKTTVKLPIFWAFRFTSILLILFAAGMLSRGYGELVEAHVLPTLGIIPTFTLSFIPANGIVSDITTSILGLTREMSGIALFLWSLYIGIVSWLIFFRQKQSEEVNTIE